MSDSPIIAVQVDDSEFNRFLEKFEGYKKEAGTSPDPFARAASSLHEAGEALSGLSNEFSSLATSAGSSAMSGPNSFISKWTKGSHQAAADWAATSKSIGTSRRELISFDRVWRNVKSVGKDASIIGGVAAAGFATAIRAADNLARKNLEARSVGVPLGRLDALESDYSPLGLSRNDVSKFADAKDDLTLQQPLRAARMSADDIRNSSADELTLEAFEKMSKQFGEWQRAGSNANTLAEVFGYTKFFSLAQLRAGASFGPEKLSDTHVRFEADADRMSIDQGTADDATKFKQTWSADLAKLGNAFDAEIGRASPELGRLADAASTAGLSLIRWFGPKAAKLAGQTADVLDDLNNGPKAAPVDGTYPHTLEGGLRKTGDLIRSTFPSIPDSTMPGVNADHLAGDASRIATFRRLEALNHLASGTLDNVERQESARGLNLGPHTNRSDGPAGPFQIDKATAAAVGVTDRMDEMQSAAGAAKLLNQLVTKYHGDRSAAYAAYDGFKGLDADIAKWGSAWRDHLAEFGSPKAVRETTSYLDQMDAHAGDFEKFVGATNDANLKVSTDSSLEPGETVVDAPTGSKQDSISLKKQIEDAVRVKRMAMEETANNFLRILHEGGLASLANNNAYGPSKTAQHQGNRSPVLIDVKVSTPAGSSTSVAMSGIPK